MRIVLFIVGTVAVIYLMVKGFRQVLEEARARQDEDASAQHHQRQQLEQRQQSADEHATGRYKSGSAPRQQDEDRDH